jgi:hypothetical protein
MQFDEARWRRLLDAYRNAVDDGPTFPQLQAAQQRRTQARNILAGFKARGARGNLDRKHLNTDDLERAHDNSVRELEQRVVEAEHETERVEARSRAAAERRAVLGLLVEGVRAWAAAQEPPVRLPGDDASVLPTMGVPAPRLVSPPATPQPLVVGGPARPAASSFIERVLS